MAVASLYFWNLLDPTANPEAVRQALENDARALPLRPLPFARILKTLKQTLPRLVVSIHRRAAEIEVPEEEAALQFRWSNSHLVVLGYGDPFRQMQRVVEAMTQAGVACYVPDDRKQYTIAEPPLLWAEGGDEPPTEAAMVEAVERQLIAEDHHRVLRGVSQADAAAALQQYVAAGGPQRAHEQAVRRVRAVSTNRRL